MEIRDHRRAWHDAARELLPPGIEVWDAHCHTGDADPDGVTGTADELLVRLDRVGHAGAVIMTSRDQGGYPPANDRVLAEAAASGGRLIPFARVDPHRPDAAAEAERSLAAGHRGLKLHPRGEDFGLDHPRLPDVARIAAARRVPVLVHAGRGIPPLHDGLLGLLDEVPGLAVILAHCAISDLAQLGPRAAELPGVYFDTAWWDATDVLGLFAAVPTGRILYASDTPYGRPPDAFTRTMRVAAAAGLDAAACAAVFGGTLRRLIAGEDEAGPPVPPPAVPVPRPGMLRLYASLHGAVVELFAGRDGTEAMELARAACRVPPWDADAAAFAAIGAGLDAALAAPDGRRGRRAQLGLLLTLSAGALTPTVPVPAVAG